ncbi:MAG: cupredoxin domain-containing protein [Nitrososphaeraceae archaeon]
MLKGISRNKSLLLAALFLALALMVAPSASRNILAYPTGRMAVQQEGYTYGQKTSVKDAPVGAISSSSSNSSTSGQEKKGVYTWSNKHGTNPVLTFKLDVNNVVHIKNPTDSKHQLIITSSGSQAASSGDVNPGSTGQLSFSPTTAGTFQYHCLYHPTTMKGTIKISP